MIRITATLIGDREVSLRLQTLRALRFTAFHDEAAKYMRRSVEQNYEAQSAPSGTPWRPHSPAYLQWLASHGASPGPGVLQLSGRMKRSLMTRANETQGTVFYRSVRYRDALHGRGATTDTLALYHTFGVSARAIPPRPQMGFSTSRDDVAALEAMLRRFVTTTMSATA